MSEVEKVICLSVKQNYLTTRAACVIRSKSYPQSTAAISENFKERITLNIGKNQSTSKAEHEAFPPEKYPLQIHLLFGRRYAHVIEELKTALDTIPKDKARYKKTESKHTGGISFYCYFKDTDAMRPFAQSLKGKGLYVEPMLGEAKQVFPQQLVEMANQVLASGRQR